MKGSIQHSGDPQGERVTHCSPSRLEPNDIHFDVFACRRSVCRSRDVHSPLWGTIVYPASRLEALQCHLLTASWKEPQAEQEAFCAEMSGIFSRYMNPACGDFVSVAVASLCVSRNSYRAAQIDCACAP